MKTLILIAVLLLLTHIAIAETPGALLIPSEIDAQQFKERDSVSKELADEDIGVLIYALRRGYGGYSQLKPEIEATIIPELQALQLSNLSSIEICRALGEVLDRIADNHISVRIYGSDERCGKSSGRAPSVGPNVETDKTLPWGLSSTSVNGTEVPIISMTTMMLSTSSTWNGFLEKIREIYLSAPALIIDLRGNPGGDDSKAREMANILAGNSDEEGRMGPSARLVLSQTPESMAMFSNYFLYVLKVGNSDGSAADPSFSEYYAQYLEKYHQASRGEIPTTSEFHRVAPPLNADTTFKGPIRILIDAGCASSCESAVTFFEGFPDVKTVGENTGGYFHFGNVGKLWLKNANVFVHLPIQSWLYDDGRFIEKIGIAPDIQVTPGNDALDAAKQDLLDF